MYQREYERRVRTAVVGIGSHSYRNILPALHFLPVELKAVCNRSNRDMAEKTAAEYGCRWYQDTEEMYRNEELDAVLFCVSADRHPSLIKEAFSHGIHAWAEKPLAVNSLQIKELISLRNGLVAMAGYKKAFMPAVRKALEVIHSDEYGDLQSMLAVYPVRIPEGNTKDWLNNGCHPLSVLLAAGGKVNSAVSLRNESGSGSSVLFFENGTVGTLLHACGPQPLEDYHFYAPSWHLQIDNTSKVILQRGIPSVYGRTTSFVPEGFDSGALVWEAQNCKATLENMSFFLQGIYDELLEFFTCILENRMPQTGSLEFALELTKVYEALMESRGNRIDL